MVKYDIEGMSCAACSARIEKAVSSVEGVTLCSVNLLTNSMTVEGNASDDDIVTAVIEAGYGVKRKGKGSSGTKDGADSLNNKEYAVLIKRLVFSLFFLLVLMYVSMGHMMWGWPLPYFLSKNHMSCGLLQLLLSATVLIINQRFFISGFKGLIHRSPNMDTLVALGSGVSFLYSTVVLFLMSEAQINGAHEVENSLMHGLYFESAAMILVLITLGKLLESYSKGKTTDAVRSLMELSPDTATVERDGAEVIVLVEEVKKGDVFLVRPGESIPVDGIIIEGHCSVDESAISGESIPIDKFVGDEVSAATVNRFGFVRCEALRVGEDTTLSRIIQMVSDAAATKAPIAKLADKVSGIFVPVVILIAMITFSVWMLCGVEVGFALARAISVLVISCPCALGLATPVAIMVGNGVGARNGILFKTAVSLEEAGKIKTVVFDKTGTVTLGEPHVTDVLAFGSYTDEELLSVAFSVEKKSEHPLSKAIVAECESRGITLSEISSFDNHPGCGVSGVLDGREVRGGNVGFVSEVCNVDYSMIERGTELSSEGKTPMFFSVGDELAGVIAVADVVKDDSARAISDLKALGIRTVMLTGDNELTAKAVGKIVGIDDIISGVLPKEKAEVITNLTKTGKTAMVGDGVNDAPALKSADVGIAIGAGTDVAIEAADIVLMNSRLDDVTAAFRLSRAVLKNIKENLFWAFFYNSIGIPLAAGVFIPAFNWELEPMFGAAAMSLSSFCVVTNALRLNFTKIRRSKIKVDESNISIIQKENEKMKITLKIEGMMCPHCEARVKKVLESLEQIESAEVSHKEKSAVVTLREDVDVSVLEKLVEDQGYTIIK